METSAKKNGFGHEGSSLELIDKKIGLEAEMSKLNLKLEELERGYIGSNAVFWVYFFVSLLIADWVSVYVGVACILMWAVLGYFVIQAHRRRGQVMDEIHLKLASSERQIEKICEELEILK